MARKSRPNTAEVVIRFRVPKGVTASQAKYLIWNNMTGNSGIYPDAHEEEIFGEQIIKPKAVSARIVKSAERKQRT